MDEKATSPNLPASGLCVCPECLPCEVLQSNFARTRGMPRHWNKIRQVQYCLHVEISASGSIMFCLFCHSLQAETTRIISGAKSNGNIDFKRCAQSCHALVTTTERVRVPYSIYLMNLICSKQCLSFETQQTKIEDKHVYGNLHQLTKNLQ